MLVSVGHMDNMPSQPIQVEQTGHLDHDSCVNFSGGGAQRREALKEAALRNALRKRAAGVPTYSVPEAAALLSISQEHLYRLVQSDGFPALHMQRGGKQGRYIVPAVAVERLLTDAADASTCVDVTAWTSAWQTRTSGGAA